MKVSSSRHDTQNAQHDQIGHMRPRRARTCCSSRRSAQTEKKYKAWLTTWPKDAAGAGKEVQEEE